MICEVSKFHYHILEEKEKTTKIVCVSAMNYGHKTTVYNNRIKKSADGKHAISF